jgi:LysM repeat protein
MGRTWATVALCLAACVTGVSPAAGAAGGETIAQAPSLEFNQPVRGQLHDGAFYSGYSVAFWTASLVKGDRMTIRTRSSGDDTPPCQILYMPGADDTNVGATTPILEPTSQTRHGSSDGQRFVAATETGTYVLAMTNADVYLSGPHQCLDAPAGRPFTFTVTVAHRGSVAPPAKKGGEADHASTHVVEAGQSLWVIAQGIVGRPASIGEIAFEVQHLWALNTARIGTGNPDLIYPGQRLRLK